jgi:hypothetical protein
MDKSLQRPSHRPRPYLAVQGLILLLITAQACFGAQAARTIKFKRGQTSVQVKGQFTRDTPEVSYTIRARAGQHMRVEVIPLTRHLNIEGHVKFPKSDLEPGNPGRFILDENLPEDGTYRILITQRYNERRTGKFILKIEIL